jgi:hypothetical protein
MALRAADVTLAPEVTPPVRADAAAALLPEKARCRVDHAEDKPDSAAACSPLLLLHPSSQTTVHALSQLRLGTSAHEQCAAEAILSIAC